MEILDELPGSARSKYDYSAVEANPGKWVAMPEMPVTVPYHHNAKNKGYDAARRNGVVYMRKPLEGEGKR